MSLALLDAIRRSVDQLPVPVVNELTATLTAAHSRYDDWLVNQILQRVSNPRLRRIISALLTAWRDQNPMGWDSRELAAAMISAAHVAQGYRQDLAVDLVWTGPGSSNLPIRRTDQVLLQLIRDCQHDLTIISFAIYKIPAIVKALQAALDRGVALRIVAESPESGSEKIPFGLQTTFGTALLKRANVLIWPKNQRPVDAFGNYGSLHIKGAVADSERLFITSANLTEYALSLNMELGTLIINRELALRVNRQIDHLVQANILVAYPDTQ